MFKHLSEENIRLRHIGLQIDRLQECPHGVVVSNLSVICHAKRKLDLRAVRQSLLGVFQDCNRGSKILAIEQKLRQVKTEPFIVWLQPNRRI